MAVVRPANYTNFSLPFNKKSSIIVHGGGGPSFFDTRTNDAVATTPTSGAIENRLNNAYDNVYFYISGGPY